MTVAQPPEPQVVLSELAQTVTERNKIRRATKWRKGFALTPQGQARQHHKQRRQNRQD